MNEDAFWAAAAEVLTEKQLQVYRLHHRHRLSLRQIAYHMNLSVSTVRGHLDAADRNIENARRKAAA